MSKLDNKSAQPHSSCLIEKLNQFIDLSGVDKDLLATLEKSSQQFDRHEQVWGVDTQLENMYVVKQGWLITYTILQDGRRQVLELHYPGDVIGSSDIPFRHATSNLMAVEPCVLCPFPKSAIDVIFRESPRLTALIFTLAMIDKSINLDRIRILGRMSARERLAHILLEIHSRLSLTGGVSENQYRLPLSQFDLGDAVGLTNVSVSNGLTHLEEDGLISRSKGMVELKKIDRLTKLSDYINRYHEVDISWFPDAST